MQNMKQSEETFGYCEWYDELEEEKVDTDTTGFRRITELELY